MDQKERCQSCGMPLGEDGLYGTEADGAETHTYCKFCYQQGQFMNPNQTLEEMIQSSVDFMVKNLHMPKENAIEMSNSYIPQLARWKK